MYYIYLPFIVHLNNTIPRTKPIIELIVSLNLNCIENTINPKFTVRGWSIPNTFSKFMKSIKGSDPIKYPTVSPDKIHNSIIANFDLSTLPPPFSLLCLLYTNLSVF